jgi:hypothetical protein
LVGDAQEVEIGPMTRSPEQQYLITLARAWVEGATGPVVPPMNPDPAAMRAALLAHNVDATLGPLLPANLRTTTFDDQMAASRIRTTDLLLECERILPLVRRHVERPLLLKGGALALRTYPDPGQRWFLDLDLLVPRSAVAAVCHELEQAGYRPLPNGRDPRFYEKYHLHRILLGPSGACVEVHWDLTLPGSVYLLSAAGVTARARPHRLGRMSLWHPSPVDQILHAVYQNIADGYLDLRRVLDLALLVPALSPAESVMLVDLAERAGLERSLALSLHVMKSVTGVESEWMAPLDYAFGSAAWRMVRGLDVVGGCLDRRARAVEGYTALLHLLTTPRGGLRLRETARLLWVGEERLLDMGHRAGALPGLWGRTRVGLHQALLLVRMTGLAMRALTTPQ